MNQEGAGKVYDEQKELKRTNRNGTSRISESQSEREAREAEFSG